MWSVPLRFRSVTLDGSRTCVMGVLNVTPDSFSDGGAYLAQEAALARARALVAEGADLVDVGGESTRPGATAVPAELELARVLPVVRALAAELRVPISIDTYKAEVAEAALAAGAEVVNDVSGGCFDPAILDVCAARGATLVVGHLRGRPASMQERIEFTDVVAEVGEELAQRLAAARAAGVTSLVADPGIGFGKTTEHNVMLLAGAGALARRLAVPLLIGASRKGFLGALSGGLPPSQRVFASVGAAAAAALRGAGIVRVHDVAATRQALAVVDAVRALG